MAGRKVHGTVIDELRKCVRSAHVCSLRSLRGDLELLAVLHIYDTVVSVRYIAGPALAAAGVNEQVVPCEIQPCSDHLIDIICRGAVPALKVGADDIDHHREVLVRDFGQFLRCIERGSLTAGLVIFPALGGAAVICALLPHDHQFRFLFYGDLSGCLCSGDTGSIRSIRGFGGITAG